MSDYNLPNQEESRDIYIARSQESLQYPNYNSRPFVMFSADKSTPAATGVFDKLKLDPSQVEIKEKPVVLKKVDTSNMNTIMFLQAAIDSLAKSQFENRHHMKNFTNNFKLHYKEYIADFAAKIYMMNDQVAEGYEAKMELIERIGSRIANAEIETLMELDDFLAVKENEKKEITTKLEKPIR